MYPQLVRYPSEGQSLPGEGSLFRTALGFEAALGESACVQEEGASCAPVEEVGIHSYTSSSGIASASDDVPSFAEAFVVVVAFAVVAASGEGLYLPPRR